MTHSIKSLKAFILLNGKAEVWKLFKYGVVGGSSLAIHAGLYYVLSRMIWPAGPKTFEYIITMLIVGVYHFTLQRIWTFSTKGFSSAMVFRYLMAVGFGISLQSGIFSICYDLMHLMDFYAFGISVGFSSLLQYFVQRFFTFSDRFEKKKAKDQEEIPIPVL